MRAAQIKIKKKLKKENNVIFNSNEILLIAIGCKTADI
jgi:hypothetical protein